MRAFFFVAVLISTISIAWLVIKLNGLRSRRDEYIKMPNNWADMDTSRD
jgi:hypothetical protein